MFCLGGIACDDDGEMFSLMVCLINKKKYQNKINYLNILA
jgi:hypothetical protein